MFHRPVHHAMCMAWQLPLEGDTTFKTHGTGAVFIHSLHTSVSPRASPECIPVSVSVLAAGMPTIPHPHVGPSPLCITVAYLECWSLWNELDGRQSRSHQGGVH